MDKLKGDSMITDMFKSTPLGSVGLIPKLENQEIILEINEHQLKEMILKGVDDRVKRNINLKIETGKIVISVRLV